MDTGIIRGWRIRCRRYGSKGCGQEGSWREELYNKERIRVVKNNQEDFLVDVAERMGGKEGEGKVWAYVISVGAHLPSHWSWSLWWKSIHYTRTSKFPQITFPRFYLGIHLSTNPFGG